MKFHIISCIVFLTVLSSCFTGVENTGRISEKDVAKLKADKKSVEELFLDSVKPDNFTYWHKGKSLYVTDNNIRLVLAPSNQYDLETLELKGDTLEYGGYRFVKQIDNAENIVMTFYDKQNRTYYYNTGKMLEEISSVQRDYSVPFLIDLDYVEKVNSMLKGKTLYIRTSLWLDTDRQATEGFKYVPVDILSVEAGDSVYPFLVNFEYGEMKASVYMSSYTSSIRNMTFDKLFSFADIRKKYDYITEDNWNRIIRGNIADGMTKEECSLSLGSPRSIDRMPTHGGMYERWSYDNGVYLIFENGLLTRYRN